MRIHLHRVFYGLLGWPQAGLNLPIFYMESSWSFILLNFKLLMELGKNVCQFYAKLGNENEQDSLRMKKIEVDCQYNANFVFPIFIA